MMQSDRFELLSAYIDDEVTASERQQVEQWLSQDAEFQRLYRRLTGLNQGFAAIAEPEPISAAQAAAITDGVFAKTQPVRPWKLWAVGAGAIAAGMVTALSSLVTGDGGMQYSPAAIKGGSAPTIAMTSPAIPSASVSSDVVMISLNDSLMAPGDGTASPTP
jgi:anti-sigma factor RsiW